MAYNAVAFKKSMLAWESVAKKAPADITQAGKQIAAEHPEAVSLVASWANQVTLLNEKLGDLLDDVVTAKDDKGRVDAAKKALGQVKQYQSFVISTHLPPGVQTSLKNGLSELAKGLGT